MRVFAVMPGLGFMIATALSCGAGDDGRDGQPATGGTGGNAAATCEVPEIAGSNLAQAAAAVAARACALWTVCMPGYVVETDCVARLTGYFERAGEAGFRGMSADRLAACAASDWSIRSCATFPRVYPGWEVDDVIPGDPCGFPNCHAQDAACVDFDDCCADGRCEFENGCRGTLALGAKCSGGRECVSGSYCSDSGVCVALPEAGQPCTNPPACATGYYCAGVAPGSSDVGTCAARPGEGMPCPDGACQTGLACVTGTCIPLPSEGEACATTGQPCASGLECVRVADAGTGAGTCLKPGAHGAACAEEEDCQEPFICSNGRCAAAGGDGEPCPCMWGFECANGSCRSVLGEGAPCSTGDDCGEGFICDASACARVAGTPKTFPVEGEPCQGSSVEDCAGFDVGCVNGLCVQLPDDGEPCLMVTAKTGRCAFPAVCSAGMCRLVEFAGRCG